MSRSPVFYHNPELEVECYAIVPHPDGGRLLALAAGAGWTLPHFRAREHATGAADHINRRIGAQLGLDVTTLRHAGGDYDPQTKRAARLYLLETHNPAWTPPEGGRWFSPAELRALALDPPGQLDTIAAALADDAEDTPPPYRLPWSRRGWYAEASAWIAARATDAGLSPQGAVRQVMVWEQSCVLRAATSGGDLYLKASPPMYAHETATTHILSRLLPRHTPAVVAVDPDRRWLLMRDLDGQPLMDSAEQTHWLDALAEYAQLQIESLPEIESLVDTGLPDNRPQMLAERVDALVADPSYCAANLAGGLAPEAVERLQRLAGQFKDALTRLAATAPPPTLEHGDLHPHNVHIVDDRPRYFDWSLSAWTHPFFSLAYFLDYLASGDIDAPPPDALRDAYLDIWAPYAPRRDLLDALQLAQRLLPLYWALNYHHIILPKMEKRDLWLRQKGLPFLLDQLLERWSAP